MAQEQVPKLILNRGSQAHTKQALQHDTRILIRLHSQHTILPPPRSSHHIPAASFRPTTKSSCKQAVQHACFRANAPCHSAQHHGRTSTDSHADYFAWIISTHTALGAALNAATPEGVTTASQGAHLTVDLLAAQLGEDEVVQCSWEGTRTRHN